MNCIVHNDVAAVNTCGVCNGGLCPECVRLGLTYGDKYVCETCFVSKVSNHLEYLNMINGKVKRQKIVWSVILALGVVAMVAIFISIMFENSGRSFGEKVLGGLGLGYFDAAIIWGFASFFRVRELLPEKIRDVSWEIRDEIQTQRMIADNSIWFYWLFQIAWAIFKFVMYGAFFPFFYLKLIFMTQKEINEVIAENQGWLDNLASRK